MKSLFAVIFLLWSVSVQAALTDIKFGRYQIADSQWNVGACLYTTTCQIYSKNPGVMYKIPWTSGQWSWQAGQYVKFSLSGNASFPYEGKVYNSDGSVAGTIGLGKIVNMGPDYFFFVGSDNNTGQLFSGSSGMNNTAGVSWTGTLNPTTAQANTYADANYSTVPLSQGQTATQTPSNSTPSPVPTAIYNNSSNVWITNHYPTSNNSPPGEDAAKAFDNDPNTKYLNFDKYNAGVTIKLNTGRVVTGFKLTTANDFPGRDPTSYKLYGSNNGTTWTLIQQGNLSLSNDRFWTSPMITITNSTAYVYYYIFFPTTKSGDGCGLDCDSMQIAEITYYYDSNNATTSTDNSGGNAVSNPGSFCCGGTNTPFSASQAFSNRAQTFAATGDNKVVIEQVGNNNSVSVIQVGAKNHTEYRATGSNNSATITQNSSSTTIVNYIETTITGNGNTSVIDQNSTGGSKGVLMTINNNSNNISVQQQNNGSHYAEINLSGSNKTVNLTQQGSGNHMARIELTGGTTSITATQSGSNQQSYSITHSCATSSCSAITVTQGQQ